jgi:hypothetical protein
MISLVVRRRNDQLVQLAISQKRYVKGTSFAWRFLLHIRTEDDVGDVFQWRNRAFHIFGREQVDIDRQDTRYLLQSPSGQSKKPLFLGEN